MTEKKIKQVIGLILLAPLVFGLMALLLCNWPVLLLVVILYSGLYGFKLLLENSET